MKKLLYGSTALLAAGMLASSAQAADKIKVGVGGYFQALGYYTDQDDGAGEPGANTRDYGIAREGEIIFNGKTTLDNGLEVGVQVQLEAETCGDQIDESFIWFEGGWGRINLGAENSAPYLMGYGLPSVGILTTDPNFRLATAPAAAAGQNARSPFTVMNLTNDSEKITYFTPRIAGFQFGVSYTPDACEEATTGGLGIGCGGSFAGPQADNTAGQASEVFEAGINYVQKFGAFDVALFGGYATGELEANVAGSTLDDPEQWGLGAQIGWAGFTVGGSWTDTDNNILPGGTVGDRDSDRTDYNLGVSYKTGPWGVSAGWAHSEVEQTGVAGEDELDVYEIAASYDLGPGVQLVGGVERWNWDDSAGAAAAENEATILFVGTYLSF